ncbi:MAG: hypothetical protein JJV92_10750 [Desulfosarcina sp.]|nr:hypothetical protein [Desulfobacterales bacterium]
MSFKENLMDKIKIDKITEKVRHSIGPPGSNSKIDKAAMKFLMEKSPYKFRKARDLELFVKEVDAGRDNILVLDNELALYKTSVDDVAMRKSPTVKEMLYFRNAIKILNDKDVVVSKREESLETIHQECVEMIDLTFNKADIADIEKEGAASLKTGYMEGVIESLELFAELLDYRSPPRGFKIPHNLILGALTKAKTDEVMFGPILIYSNVHNTLKLIDDLIGNYDKGKIELFKQIVAGKTSASLEGEKVFEFLREAVVNRGH